MTTPIALTPNTVVNCVVIRCKFEFDANHGADWLTGKPQRLVEGGRWITLRDAPEYWEHHLSDIFTMVEIVSETTVMYENGDQAGYEYFLCR
jgi:hypothetical protein